MSEPTPDLPGRVSIRRAAPDEAAAVAALAARTFTDAFGAENEPAHLHAHLAAQCSPAAVRRQLLDPAWTTLVAGSPDTLCGYAQLCDTAPPQPLPCSRPRQLYRLYLDRAWWGRGLAQDLIVAAEVEARQRGADGIWLTTWDRNARGLAFYRKQGFETVGVTTFLVGEDPQRDLVLFRRLD